MGFFGRKPSPFETCDGGAFSVVPSLEESYLETPKWLWLSSSQWLGEVTFGGEVCVGRRASWGMLRPHVGDRYLADSQGLSHLVELGSL
jgi:hypothetical protein